MSRKQPELSVGFERFTLKNITIIGLIALTYLGWIYSMVGLRGDHVYLVVACVVAYYATNDSRKALYGFAFILLYWWVYDSLRVYPNYLVNTVHIEDLYDWEKSWFGIQTASGVITPNEYFLANNNSFLDVVSGLFYLSWIPVPVVFGLYLFMTNRGMMVQFMFTFFLANVIAIFIYYAYPAAPPWYVQKYGFIENFDMMGNAAGLLKFDEFFNINVFKGMYDKNGNVFAAMPSMHSAFPVLLFYFGVKSKIKWWWSAFFLSTVIGIWFAAVYTSHHYIIDVICGALCAIVTIIIIEYLLSLPLIKRWYHLYKGLMN
ncbi:MAG: phosphatase PAP2 family protein [Bacteroidota bacterium]